MKKILLIASKYSTTSDSPYLTNDLALELVRLGHHVTIIAYGDATIKRTSDYLSEHVIDISSNVKYLKYFLIWPRLFLLALEVYKKNKDFDQIIMFAPLSTMLPAAFFIRHIHAAKKTAIIFDIFPIAQMKIGALPAWLANTLLLIERYLLSGFSEITAMGKNNKKYIEEYYQTEKMNCPVKVVNLWGRNISHARVRNIQHTDALRIIFGGQIIKGRELEALILFFSTLRKKGMQITFDIYSQGVDFEILKEFYAKEKWLKFKEQLPRERYIAELANYNIGAIVTDKRSDLPTFPSKIIDYVSAGLRVYALVEEESDFNTELSNFTSVVYTNAFDYSDEEIDKSISFLNAAETNAHNLEIEKIRKIFSVTTATTRLLA